MKPTPASRMQWPIASGVMSILTPSAVSTSAAPVCEDRPRLPCLATGTPAPAITKAEAVEMLTLCEPSPPVPTMSMAPSGASTFSIFSRMVATAPEISLDRLAAHAQRHQEGADLAGRRLAGHDDVERRARLVEGERLAGRDLGDMGFELAHRARQKASACWIALWSIGHVVLALQPRHQLVEQVVGKAGGERFARVLGHRIRRRRRPARTLRRP